MELQKSDLLPEGLFPDEPEKQQAYREITEIIENRFPLITSLKDFYQALGDIVTRVNIIYEDIQCKSGCSRCCKFYGSPQVYKKEWENIQHHLEKNFSEAEMKRVREKLNESTEFFKNELENEGKTEEVSNPLFTVSVFYASECPFLYKNMCSIYEVRPFICRIFGNTSVTPHGQEPEKTELSKKILACSEERSRWAMDALEKGENELLLPERNILEKKLLEILGEKNVLYYTMQYWLTEFLDEY